MDTPSASTRIWARRLLAVEAANSSTPDGHVHEAVRACKKLRTALALVAGSDGFAALQRRALALAQQEAPVLQTVTAKADGSLEGFENVLGNAGNGATEAAVAFIGHLLGLLVTFVGESLTLRLVRNAWPDAAFDGGTEGFS